MKKEQIESQNSSVVWFGCPDDIGTQALVEKILDTCEFSFFTKDCLVVISDRESIESHFATSYVAVGPSSSSPDLLGHLNRISSKPFRIGQTLSCKDFNEQED